MRGERERGGRREEGIGHLRRKKKHGARERKNEKGRIVMCRTENLCVSKQAYTRDNKVNLRKFMTKSVFRKNCNWQA